MDSHPGQGFGTASSISMAAGVPQATMDPFILHLRQKKDRDMENKKPKLQIMKHQSLSPNYISEWRLILVTFCPWFMLMACEPRTVEKVKAFAENYAGSNAWHRLSAECKILKHF